jgi:hypothetical protein
MDELFRFVAIRPAKAVASEEKDPLQASEILHAVRGVDPKESRERALTLALR